ncbi:MAG: hypothetical protein Q9P14_07000 [candidate division KSB1 bacterium]|nr:hypothetical protein [candidate division KSB1 bacterium]
MKLGPMRPFIRLGIGGFNFEATSGKRFNDGEAIGGGGLRLFLSRRLALTLAGYGKYTTGDDLDGVRGGDKDIYWGVRGGLMLYSGGKKEEITREPMMTEEPTELPPSTEMTGEPTGTEADSAQMVDIRELQQLQERKDALQRQLSDKEQEIEALRQAVARRETEIESLQGEIEALKQRTSTSAAATGNFRAAYRQALELFGNRQVRRGHSGISGAAGQVSATPAGEQLLVLDRRVLFCARRFEQCAASLQ